MERTSNGEVKVSKGNFNILTTFAVRYALCRDTLAANTMERILGESLSGLHEQTKYGIIRDIEDYIDQNETVPDLETLNRIKTLLKKDIEGRKNG